MSRTPLTDAFNEKRLATFNGFPADTEALLNHARHMEELANGIKAEAEHYRRFWDACFEMGLVRSDPGNVPTWTDEMINAIRSKL